MVLRERQDAGDVVALGGFFFLAEVADQVAAVVVAGGHAVEEERVDVVVERFVVEEEFREEAEVAAPASLSPAVDLEEGDVVVAIDFVARRVQERAFGAVALEWLEAVVVGEAEFADVDHVCFGESLRIGAEVPGFHFMFAHLDSLEVAYAGNFCLVLCHAAASAELFDFFLTRVGTLFGGRPGSFGGGGGILEVGNIEVTIVRLGGIGGDLGGNHGDGLVATGTVVLLTADK